MLEADSRNCISWFSECSLVVHGWEYRRYVVSNIEKVRGVSLAQSEFDYTTTKTNNISNFSAWHNRANLIPHLLPPVTASTFEEERKQFLQRGPNQLTSALIIRTRTNSQWPLGRSGWPEYVALSFLAPRRNFLSRTAKWHQANSCTNFKGRKSQYTTIWDSNAGRIITRSTRIKMSFLESSRVLNCRVSQFDLRLQASSCAVTTG